MVDRRQSDILSAPNFTCASLSFKTKTANKKLTACISLRLPEADTNNTTAFHVNSTTMKNKVINTRENVTRSKRLHLFFAVLPVS